MFGIKTAGVLFSVIKSVLTCLALFFFICNFNSYKNKISKYRSLFLVLNLASPLGGAVVSTADRNIHLS